MASGKFKGTPFDKLANLVDNFVTTFGAIAGRGLFRNSRTGAAEAIINPKVAGIKDVFDAFKTFISDIKSLTTLDVDSAVKVMDTILPKIRDFVERLGLFGARTLGVDTITKSAFLYAEISSVVAIRFKFFSER